MIGCEAYVAPRSRHQKEPRLDDFQYHLVLLAENQEGYRNLMRLVSAGFLEGFYYKPRMDRSLLEAHREGLIALSGCLAGEIPSLLLQGKAGEARAAARYYRELFGPENFYIELQDQRLPEQASLNEALIRLAREEKIPLVATNDVHYLRREDAEIHDVLLCIQTGKTIHDPNRLRFESQEFSRNLAEMAGFALPRRSGEYLRIAERCRVEFDFDGYHLPEYDLPSGKPPTRPCGASATRAGGKVPGSHPQCRTPGLRAGVIKQMGYSSYF